MTGKCFQLVNYRVISCQPLSVYSLLAINSIILNVVKVTPYLHMFPERAGVSVGLVAARHSTVVRFVGRVHMRVFLAVRAVGEPSVTSCILALERLLPWNIQPSLDNVLNKRKTIKINVIVSVDESYIILSQLIKTENYYTFLIDSQEGQKMNYFHNQIKHGNYTN